MMASANKGNDEYLYGMWETIAGNRWWEAIDEL
jgi:hypothetical protein